MLSARPLALEGELYYTKTPARVTRDRNFKQENRIPMTVNGKGKALQTPRRAMTVRTYPVTSGPAYSSMTSTHGRVAQGPESQRQAHHPCPEALRRQDTIPEPRRERGPLRCASTADRQTRETCVA